MNLGKLGKTVRDREARCTRGRKESDATWRLNNKELKDVGTTNPLPQKMLKGLH